MTKTGFTPENTVYTPKNIISFISELVSPWQSKRILDPACGTGSFFWNINKKAEVQQNFTGIDIGPEIIEMAKNNLETTNIFWKLINEDYFKIYNELGLFDLIVSQPSFQQLKETITVKGFQFLNNELAYLFASLDLLEEGGYLVFILPEQKSFFFSDYQCWRIFIKRSLEKIYPMVFGRMPLNLQKVMFHGPLTTSKVL